MPFDRLVPMLNVSDIERSYHFYRDHLGFELGSSEEQLREWRWCYLQAGGAQLMLMGGDRWEPLPQRELRCEDLAGVPAVYYLYHDDVAGLHEKLAAAGVEVTEPDTTFYGMREIYLLDPDGHRWTVGQESASAG